MTRAIESSLVTLITNTLAEALQLYSGLGIPVHTLHCTFWQERAFFMPQDNSISHLINIFT